ncbi:MAG: twin-arginine translocase TatA/TatE family subunit [Deltaproteobacteria bacterium]|nr:MAG: twin-arginine translocase TatA/TatE family subunit [Deltaproteobacteria bacterium]
MIGGLSMTEVIIILGLALLLLGPDQLPVLAKSLGKGLRELRKATDDLKGQFEQEIARIDTEPQRMIAPVPPPPPDDPAAARANARTSATEAAEDPAAARAAARRAAADLKVVPREGAESAGADRGVAKP